MITKYRNTFLYLFIIFIYSVSSYYIKFLSHLFFRLNYYFFSKKNSNFSYILVNHYFILKPLINYFFLNNYLGIKSKNKYILLKSSIKILDFYVLLYKYMVFSLSTNSKLIK
jgi:hypothetical protein